MARLVSEHHVTEYRDDLRLGESSLSRELFGRLYARTDSLRLSEITPSGQPFHGANEKTVPSSLAPPYSVVP